MSKNWHIVKKFIPKSKITYTPKEFPMTKRITIELPEDYDLMLLGSPETTGIYKGPCQLELDPSYWTDSHGKIELTLHKKPEKNDCLSELTLFKLISMADPIVPETPKLTPHQELNIEYNRLCNVRGDIEAKLITAETNKDLIDLEMGRLGQQRDANSKHLKELMEKAAKMPPMPSPAPVPAANP